MRTRLSLLLSAALLLAGCGGGVVVVGGDIGRFGCDDQMAAITGRLGFPEQVDRRFDGGLHIETFFYFHSGIAVAFSWGADVACDEREFRIDTPLVRAR